MNIVKYGSKGLDIYYLCIVFFSIFAPLYYLLFVDHSFWFDELWSLAGVHERFNIFITKWMLNDVHPPLYNIILWVYVRISGYSETGTRFLSYLFYLAGVIQLVYFLRNESFNYKLLFFVLTVSPLTIYYSLEVRSYSLLFFLSILFVTQLQDKLTVRQAVILIILSNIHLFGLLFSAGFLLWFFLKALRKPVLKYLLLITGTGLLCISWFIFLIIYMDFIHFTQSTTGIHGSIKEALIIFLNQFRIPLFYSLYVKDFILITLVFSLVIIATRYNDLKQYISDLRQNKILPGVVLAYLFSALVIFIIHYKRPLLQDKYILLFLPIVALFFTSVIMVKKNTNYFLAVAFIFLTIPYGRKVLGLLNAKTSEFQNHRKLWTELNNGQASAVYIFKPHNIVNSPYEYTFFKTVTLYKELLGLENIQIIYTNEEKELFQKGHIILFIQEVRIDDLEHGLLKRLDKSGIKYTLNSIYGSSQDITVLTIR